jgi:hypothetical protein
VSWEPQPDPGVLGGILSTKLASPRGVADVRCNGMPVTMVVGIAA